MLGLVGFSDWLGRTGLQFVRLQDVGKKSLAVLGDRVAQVLSSPKSHHCSQTGHACDTQVIELLNKYFVPVYISNEDYQGKNAVVPKDEFLAWQKIYLDALKEKRPAGSVVTLDSACHREQYLLHAVGGIGIGESVPPGLAVDQRPVHVHEARPGEAVLQAPLHAGQLRGGRRGEPRTR